MVIVEVVSYVIDDIIMVCDRAIACAITRITGGCCGI